MNTSQVATQTITFTPVDSEVGGSDNPFGILGDLVDELLDNLTTTIDDQVRDVEREIVSNVAEALGVKDEYNFFLRGICEGNLAKEDDPGSVEITDCNSYGNAKGEYGYGCRHCLGKY